VNGEIEKRQARERIKNGISPIQSLLTLTKSDVYNDRLDCLDKHEKALKNTNDIPLVFFSFD
jgi:hypothetical protein